MFSDMAESIPKYIPWPSTRAVCKQCMHRLLGDPLFRTRSTVSLYRSFHGNCALRSATECRAGDCRLVSARHIQGRSFDRVTGLPMFVLLLSTSKWGFTLAQGMAITIPSNFGRSREFFLWTITDKILQWREGIRINMLDHNYQYPPNTTNNSTVDPEYHL